MPDYLIREAREADLPAIIALLADDFLGRQREAQSDGAQVAEPYRRAFQEITRDPRNQLIVVEDDNRVVGTLQVTFIPSLSQQGAERCEVEAVRVASDLRGQGIGKLMLGWVIDRARERGCKVVQLATNKQRTDARRFYEQLGFVASHEGMKLAL